MKADLAFINRLRGNPKESDVEDCMSTGRIIVCDNIFTVKDLKQIKGERAQIRRRLEIN
jgi:hypothetical protein